MVLVMATVVWLWRRLSNEPPLTADRLFLLVAVVFLLVVGFGSGYGPQYTYWFVPALVATYVLLDDTWRWLLRVGYAVAGITYAFEYAFVPWLGAWMSAVLGSSDWSNSVADFLVSYRLVLFQTPLFVVYLVLVAEGVGRLAESRARAVS